MIIRYAQYAREENSFAKLIPSTPAFGVVRPVTSTSWPGILSSRTADIEIARLDGCRRPPFSCSDRIPLAVPIDLSTTRSKLMARLLLVDDEPDLIAEQVRHVFKAPSYRIDVARTGAEGLARVAEASPDVVLLDYSLPDRPGLEVFDAIRSRDARIPVVFVTLSKAANAAIEAMKRGAFDYLYKPLVENQLTRVVGDALEVAKQMRNPPEEREVVPEEYVSGELVGNCPAMREVYKSIGRVAAQHVPVLITGESGTGKELVARSIHQHSERNKGAFLALNCAAIPEQLLESELFGHEKGAFTGADRRRIGRFEQCDGGTLFLDEIGDMPVSLQAKMLRILQEQAFQRVGGEETIRTDVRIISATHQDLKTLSASEKFRDDLYYRLGVFNIHLPPLRERGDDLPLLVRYFLRRFGQELNRDTRDASPEAMTRLQSYSWPGNLRELQSVLKQSLLLSSGPLLLPAMLPNLSTEESRDALDCESPAKKSGLKEFILQRLTAGSELLHEEAHRELDLILLPEVMEYTKGNQLQAAKVLGVARQTLRRRLRGLHITPRFTDEEEVVE
jgi:DNA-binding NtrC family response regulator